MAQPEQLVGDMQRTEVGAGGDGGRELMREAEKMGGGCMRREGME